MADPVVVTVLVLIGEGTGTIRLVDGQGHITGAGAKALVEVVVRIVEIAPDIDELAFGEAGGRGRPGLAQVISFALSGCEHIVIHASVLAGCGFDITVAITGPDEGKFVASRYGISDLGIGTTGTHDKNRIIFVYRSV